jgi:quercetin dioxygenase-like cupin family protein
MEEKPEQVIPALVSFLDGGSKKTSANVRMTAPEIDAQDKVGPGAGTSGVAGIQTGTLKGDPTQPGLYTIVLRVPANTQIEAHEHPDDRTATVVSGTWYFGYGDHFDDARLKALPPGSFYTEPPGQMHFARTRETPVVIQISGYGPTGTVYAKAAHAAR